MESPLDILSRAAGMVSRSNTDSSSGSSTSSRKIENNNSNSSSSSTISVTSDTAPRTDNQCGILKLALVSSATAPVNPVATTKLVSVIGLKPPWMLDTTNHPTVLPPEITPPPAIPALPQNLTLNGNGHLKKTQEYVRVVDEEAAVPVNLGKRSLVSSPCSSPVRKCEEPLDVDSDLDRPLDFSMKKLNKKRVKDDSDSDEGPQPLFRQHSWRDFKMKRKRPSVISYASHPPQSQHHSYSPPETAPNPPKPKHPNVVRNDSDALDVDDHFKKSLGLEFYNSVFSAEKRKREGKAEEVPVPRSPEIQVDDKPFKPSIKSQEVPAKETKREIKVEQPSAVDDHFEKALGKSTWLKLQGL